jgi:hypothetical protein
MCSWDGEGLSCWELGKKISGLCFVQELACSIRGFDSAQPDNWSGELEVSTPLNLTIGVES